MYSDINHIPNSEEKAINGINGFSFKYTYTENPEYGFMFSDGKKIYTVYASSEELLNTVLGGVN